MKRLIFFATFFFAAISRVCAFDAATIANDISSYRLKDLTRSEFCTWDKATEGGVIKGNPGNACALDLKKASGQVYGLSTVNYLNYADLSGAEVLVATVKEGEPRFLFNRTVDEGTVNGEITSGTNADLETVVDNGDGTKTYYVDIAKLVEKQGFAHLHAIKGANWANVNVISLKYGISGYGANDSKLSAIHQKGNQLVNESDVKKVLHGVMDTPNAYFNGWRWAIDWGNQYNTAQQVTNCLNYFDKITSLITARSKGAYCDLFRLHLDPAWTNDPDKTATNGGGETDISRFSANRLKYYLNYLYWPIIENAMGKGLYIIVRPPGVCPKEIQVGDDYYNYLLTVWDIVSKDSRFQKYAGQVSIELANEPVDVFDAAGNKNSANALHDFFQPIVNMIRQNGYRGVIWVPGRGWQADYTVFASYPITDVNMGYAAHFYPGWYGTNGTYTNSSVISQFKKQVPVVEDYPVVITEVDWSPEDEGEGHNDEQGNWVVPNYGTWGTGRTSKFGNTFRAVHDYYKNISFTVEGTGLVYDIDEYLKSGKVQKAFSDKPEPDESCAICMDWYKEWYDAEDEVVPDPEPEEEVELNTTMFSLKVEDFNPNVFGTGEYSYDAATGVASFTPGQYGFGGWKSDAGFDVSEYESITVTFDEAPANGVEFRLFDVNNYWATPKVTVECDGKTSVTVDISEIDRLYFVGFWAYGGKAMKIKSVALKKKSAGQEEVKPQKVELAKTITVNGKERSYIIYVPANVTETPSLVFSLHGASGKSGDYSPFRREVADSEGCIVVYPQGLNHDFGPFGTVAGWMATGEAEEDLDFFKAIIDEVAKSYMVDRQRIYCCGFSNGGMMTYSMQNCASDIFAAFASISGYPINEMHLRHTGERPVPFLHIHGKSDDFVKYSLMGTIRDNMVARNGCNPVPQVSTNSKYTKSVYEATSGSFPYIYYEVEGMGHNDFTNSTEDGNSALTMWNFLSQYTLSDSCDKTLKWSSNFDVTGFDAAAHGWTITDGKQFVYGDADNVQNVSHSLQFEKGNYQLRFETSGDADDMVAIKLVSTSGDEVFFKSTNVGGKAYIPFSISEYGEYTLTVLKTEDSDKFVSLAIYKTSKAWSGAEEVKEAIAQTGDVNLDGTVDLNDVNLLSAIVQGKSKATSMSDVNHDGRVTIADLSKLIDRMQK